MSISDDASLHVANRRNAGALDDRRESRVNQDRQPNTSVDWTTDNSIVQAGGRVIGGVAVPGRSAADATLSDEFA